MPKQKYLTPEIMHDSPLRDSKTADFHFDDFAATLARLIASKQTETPLAIGINGAWGSGKTSLLLRVKNMLDKPQGEKGKDAHRYAQGEEHDFRICKTVWFDAWKYNDEDKLLVALVRVILQSMQRDGLANNLKAWLNDPTQESYDVVAMFINAFETSFGGLKFKLDLEKHKEPSPFKEQTAFFDYFDEAFDILLKAWSNNGVMVIFIDDLDRCLPAKTVQTLEAIKLFLDKSGCVFMLGADTRIVQMAVETHYKNAGITGESAKDYLEKVIQLRFDLPQILEDAMEKYLSQQDQVDEAMRKRWRALVAAAEVNPRRVKNVINDLNLQWFMAVNSGQAVGVNRDDFICWQALMHAAPASFVKRVIEFEDQTIRFGFIQDALKWQNGTQEEKQNVEGYFTEYKDSRRLRGVLKQISFSAEFIPETLEAMIYLSAPPTKPVVEESKQVQSEQTADALMEGSEVSIVRGKGEKPAPGRITSRDGNRLTIGGMGFMRVPAGKFIMGSKDDNEFNQGNERPQHTVELNYDYWMGKFILTNQMFETFINSTSFKTTAEEKGSGYTYDGKNWNDVKGADWKHPLGPKSDLKDRNEHPVALVSWDDSMAYCKWFNENFKTELGDLLLRLPSEAEWEKAARGVYANEWPWGNEFDPKKCNSAKGRKGGTTPVGAYSSLGGDSPYGCADMVGNVWEWTHTLFNKYPYNVKDGREDEASRNSRMLRGGSFGNSRRRVRCAARDYFDPDLRNSYLGFRVGVFPIAPL